MSCTVLLLDTEESMDSTSMGNGFRKQLHKNRALQLLSSVPQILKQWCKAQHSRPPSSAVPIFPASPHAHGISKPEEQQAAGFNLMRSLCRTTTKFQLDFLIENCFSKTGLYPCCACLCTNIQKLRTNCYQNHDFFSIIILILP